MKIRSLPLVLPALLLISACGNSDDASKADDEAAAVEAASDASVTDLGLDASTADAMSVDVAAGGVGSMAEPAAPAEADQKAATEQ